MAAFPFGSNQPQSPLHYLWAYSKLFPLWLCIHVDGISLLTNNVLQNKTLPGVQSRNTAKSNKILSSTVKF